MDLIKAGLVEQDLIEWAILFDKLRRALLHSASDHHTKDKTRAIEFVSNESE